MECKQCGKNKPERSFATFKTRKGETRRRGVCWTCRGEYATKNFKRLQQYRKTYNKANRPKKALRDSFRRAEAKAYVDKIKAQTPCADCRQRFHPVAMDFDHGDSPKTRGVAVMVGSGYRLDLIKSEIAKCEIVCANCHRVRTWTRNEHVGTIRAHKQAPDL